MIHISTHKPPMALAFARSIIGATARAGSWLLIVVAMIVAAVSMQGRYKVAVNRTASMDGRLFVVDGAGVSEGDLLGAVVAFRFDGSRWGYPDDALWAKRVAGLPGDAIEVRGADVWVAGRKVAALSEGVMGRGGVSPVGASAVPAGSVFVVGGNEDSLDSRYAEFGFPRIDELAGTASALL